MKRKEDGEITGFEKLEKQNQHRQRMGLRENSRPTNRETIMV